MLVLVTGATGKESRPHESGQDDKISYLSGLFTLVPGDLIFSGTPSGVAAVNRGDTLKGHVDGVGDLVVQVV